MQPDQAPDTSQALTPPFASRTPRPGTRTPRTPASAARTYQSPHESAVRTYLSPHGSATRTYRSPPGSAVWRSPRFSPHPDSAAPAATVNTKTYDLLAAACIIHGITTTTFISTAKTISVTQEDRATAQ
ncbi:unnamed protein product [Phytophthora fragariaefolia]|uniref:Unnamed protein product n=1 Tax=Phytophthora fragariaefolia TaxID=1490495 RepID=A0A9W6X6Q5_9STRA|nr:unnamed protein product [Phytophthora fragariaefolia]